MSGQAPVNWRAPDASAAAIERDVAHALQIGREYVAMLVERGVALSASHVLELGPGHNYGTALMLAGHGASVAVADRFPVPWHDDYHGAFYRGLADRMRAADPAAPTSAIERCVSAGAIGDAVRVLPAPVERLDGLADGSVDVVLSNAVLEHAADPRAAAAELFRVTRAGGLGIHQVDFRDHRDFSRPLEYLLLDEAGFERMFAERHGECGRQTRPHEMRQMFLDAGFEIVQFKPNWFAAEDYLDDLMPRLRRSPSDYRFAARRDLCVISGRFILRRPGA